ncbi:DEAD/DEAH box helicase [Oscillochloris sp. ZM17-4]|uniref:DEAD/DEAH box helicase n=1 Tax=Oscillochloris sp. ZM17-4 TaxID=2866714 RepID=UPI001C730D58|nr:DEAD/DEAH box helicase [Oscillochloris sp. ZM17-4]MBX0326908.1 DEAD/DEAH box helicase [Oscillochloris sp. ZM17-4]
MLYLLTAETLPVDQLLNTAMPKVVQQGRDIYQSGRAQVQHCEPTNAIISVEDGPGPPIQCVIRLSGNQVGVTCSCRYGYAWGLCQHRVAALLQLRDYLKLHPPSLWRAVLDQAIQPGTRRSSAVSTSGAALIFSLQKRGTIWSILPYNIAGKYLPVDHRGDPEVIAETIAGRDLLSHIKPIRSQVSPDTYPNMPMELLAAANTAVASGAGYGYWYTNHKALTAVFGMLHKGLVYAGDELNPIQQRLTIGEESGVIEMDLGKVGDDLDVSFSLHAGEERIALRPGHVEIIDRDPLWMRVDDRLIAVTDIPVAAETLISYPRLRIPAKDQTEFMERYLLPLAESVPVRGDMVTWQHINAEPERRLYLSERERQLVAELRFGYADYELPYEKHLPPASTRRIPDSTTLARITRHPDVEQASWQELNSFGLKRSDVPNEFLLRRNLQPIDFLLREVPKLARAGFVIYGEDALTMARVNRSTPSISFRVSSGIDWFDVTAVVNFGDQEVAMKDLRRAIRKREKFVKLADGSIGAIPDEWIERYRHMFAMAEEHEGALRLSEHHVGIIDQALAEADRAQADPEFQARRDRLRDFEKIEQKPLPAGFTGTLRPYQKAAYDWLHFLHSYGFGGCLADDMGMGKTVVALAFLQSLREQRPDGPASLIVMPRSLLFNWEREAKQFAPGLRVYVHAETTRTKDAADFAKYDLVITTYGIMLRDIELLRQYRFDCAILDESQAIKNPLGETSRAARTINADRRFALTGTPVENSALELWSQFAYLNPGLLGNLDYYREEFVNPIERKQDADSAQFLRKMVYPFILRRTKEQVALDLPPRSEELLIVEMEPAQRKLYAKTRDYYRSLLLGMIEEEGLADARMKILEGLLRLRQICNHPRLVDAKFRGSSGKFDLLMETLDTLRSEGHKALIFSQFVQMLTIIREALDTRKIPYAYLDGSTRNRQQEVDRFQNTPELPFFLISLKAGGVGLNLTAADYVIHVDPWWNPAIEMQATDRTHRIGQTRPVFVYKLITRETVEEKILLLQDQKRALVEQLIATEGGVFKSLTPADVAVLFT